MSIHKKSEGVFEVRWREGGRNKGLRVHGAYELARTGQPVELTAVPVDVHAISVVEHQGQRLVLDVECGRGTYIRALARDLGNALGLGGHLTALRRTQVGPFTLASAVKPEDLTPAALQPARSLLLHLPHARLDAPGVARVKVGRSDVTLTVGDTGWAKDATGVVEDGTTLWAIARAEQNLEAGRQVDGALLSWGRRFPTSETA